jgi:hypothetical protein
VTQKQANTMACGMAKMIIETALRDDPELRMVSLEEDEEYGYSEEDRKRASGALDALCKDLLDVEEGRATALTFPKEV